MTTEIFRSPNLLARYVPGAQTRHCVVTFDSYTDHRTLSRPGFAERFLRDRDIPAIHVISRENDWYQHREMPAALAAIRAATASFERVMTYGSSMGAYAAIRFADAVGASQVLALAPQYSLDPTRVSFDLRWLQDARRIDWRPEIDGVPIRCAADTVVIVDPTGTDQLHVALISAEIAIRSVSIRYAGHGVAAYLHECGLLAGTVLGHLQGGLDLLDLARRARAARSGSASYLTELSARQPPHRKRLALRLAKAAVGIAPDYAPAVANLAVRYTRARQHDDAIATHERAMQLSDRGAPYLHHYSRSLFEAGHRLRAFWIGIEAIRSRPAALLHYRWLLRMVLQAHRRRGLHQ